MFFFSIRLELSHLCSHKLNKFIDISFSSLLVCVAVFVCVFGGILFYFYISDKKKK
jgi:hypothetical protein